MKHSLPPLPFATDALAPVLSQRTINVHYGKHTAAYYDKLNELIRDTAFQNMPLQEIVTKSTVDTAIYNNAAQAWNHTFYFAALNANGSRQPYSELMHVITRDFGSFAAMCKMIIDTAIGIFGSGWIWLVCDDSHKLSVIATQNAGNPLRGGFTPLLTIDVWEHAYYLDYENMRASYLKNIFDIIDWNIVSDRFVAHCKDRL